MLSMGLLGAALAGCGGRFAMPQQGTKPVPPVQPDNFILAGTWTKPDWKPTSVAPFSGTLLVAENFTDVKNYTALGLNGQPTLLPAGIGLTFTGLLRPAYVAVSNSRIYIADLGDGTAAHPMTVLEYNFNTIETALSPVNSFTDTSWVRIKGLAADFSSNIYVSCDARVVVEQPPFEPVLETESLIYRYHGTYPGGERDTVAEQGTGLGFVISARGIAWADGRLYVCEGIGDGLKDWVQQLNPAAKDESFFKVDGSESNLDGVAASPLRIPTAVAALGGFFYVADLANHPSNTGLGEHHILRYASDGAFNQVVDQNDASSLHAPTAVCAVTLNQGQLHVYAADTTAHTIKIYKHQR